MRDDNEWKTLFSMQNPLFSVTNYLQNASRATNTPHFSVNCLLHTFSYAQLASGMVYPSTSRLQLIAPTFIGDGGVKAINVSDKERVTFQAQQWRKRVKESNT